MLLLGSISVVGVAVAHADLIVLMDIIDKV